MSVSEPGKIITPWAESGLKNTIPPAANPATGRAGFDQGFSAINMTAKEAGGIPPFGQDFNGIFYEVTNILRYMQAGGQPTFSAEMATAIGGYPVGAVLVGDDGKSVFQNTLDGNTNDPNSVTTGWARPDLQMVELYRRSYANAGLNLVNGSFQFGFTLTKDNDVTLDLESGKAFGGVAGTYPAGTSTAGFIDRSDEIRVSGSIDAVQFGVDASGTNPSDAQLLDALQFSAVSGIEIVVSGKCRLTQTMLQPANSIVRVDGIVFCENPAGLTGNLLWDVSGPNDTGCRTEIRTMTLSTSPTTGSAVVDRLMKPLRISTARVKCGLIKTYGFQLGGPEIGPTGFEINVAESSSVINKWDPAHRDACGFKITTSDCIVGNVLTALYPVGPKLGSTNHVGSVHCWGLPATEANEYPNAQMLTGPTLGAATTVDRIYVDSVDTDGYDTAQNGNDGLGVIFAGYECSVGNLLYRIHPQTKRGKVKLVRFTGYSNVIQALQVPGGVGFDIPNPIIYDNDTARWRNRINSSNVHSSVNVFQYGTTLAPSGFTTFTGYITVEKVSHDAVIRLFLDATAVDNSSASDFVINLPAGLSLMQGSTTIASQRTCLGMSSTDHTLTHDFAYVDNQSKIKIGYRKRDTGQLFFLKQTSLKPGNIELVLRASITNQM